jgi:hypothetical protein
MIAPKQIQKPENWQDFEKLCKKLWGEVWYCASSIKRNGRSGQNQCGVDVYGLPKGESAYHGIQCKGKDDYTKSKLTSGEIDTEILKAMNFKPALKTLIFATTADKDVRIEQYIREKSIDHLNKGLFTVDIFSWADIVDLLEEHRSTYNWFVNNCQYKDASDVSLLFKDTEEFTIHPQYIRETKSFFIKPKVNPLFNSMSEVNRAKMMCIQNIGFSPFHQKSLVDYRWCDFPLTIKNIGSTVVEDYKLSLLFDFDKTEKVSDKYSYYNPGPFYDQVTVAAINADRKKQRELFLSTEYWNVLDFRPLDPILVQDDHKSFKVGIKPKDGVDEIEIQWVLKSRDYKKEGSLTLKVVPQFEDKYKKIEVEQNELREDEITIEPKIIEE